MDTVWFVIGVVVVTLAVCIAVGWYLRHRSGPYSAESRGLSEPTTRTERLHDSVDRPAGPAAEVMAPGAVGGDHHTPRASEGAEDE